MRGTNTIAYYELGTFVFITWPTGWNSLSGTNALAYFKSLLMKTSNKSFFVFYSRCRCNNISNSINTPPPIPFSSSPSLRPFRRPAAPRRKITSSATSGRSKRKCRRSRRFRIEAGVRETSANRFRSYKTGFFLRRRRK